MKLSRTIFILAILLLSACGGASRGAAPQTVMAPPSAPMPADGSVALDQAKSGVAAEAPPASNAGGGATAPGQATNSQSDLQRMVIKNAQIALEVEKVRDAEAAIRAKVGELQGYVVTSQSNGADQDMTIDLTFRVPANQFDAALSGIQGLAKRVLSRTISGDDVTQEFVDLQSRTRNLEATRDRLLQLLQKADKVEDALAVNQSLTDVQGQLEQIQGRMQYLKQSAALSSITVSLRPVPTTPIIQDDGWNPLQVAKRSLRGLVEFGQGLAEVLIGLAIWFPVWLPIILFGRWIWRKVRSPKVIKPTPVEADNSVA